MRVGRELLYLGGLNFRRKSDATSISLFCFLINCCCSTNLHSNCLSLSRPQLELRLQLVPSARYSLSTRLWANSEKLNWELNEAHILQIATHRSQGAERERTLPRRTSRRLLNEIHYSNIKPGNSVFRRKKFRVFLVAIALAMYRAKNYD